jgi:DNA-binding NarL/FixJ family response regulator
VLLCQYADPAYALAFLEHGTEGRPTCKERVADLDHLLAAIREVAEGGSVIDPKVVETLVTARSQATQSPLARLTPRPCGLPTRLALPWSSLAQSPSWYRHR